MKTEEQIAGWLCSQFWCGWFIEQVLASHEHQTAVKILNGCYGRNTISEAFDWTRSNEGADYWKLRDYEFIKWFES